MNTNQTILFGVITLFLGIVAGVGIAQINLPATSAQQVHWMNEGYNRCESFYGIKSTDLQWIQNYIEKRKETYEKNGLWTLFTFDIFVDLNNSAGKYIIPKDTNQTVFYYDKNGNLLNYGT